MKSNETVTTVKISMISAGHKFKRSPTETTLRITQLDRCEWILLQLKVGILKVDLEDKWYIRLHGTSRMKTRLKTRE